MRLLPERLDHDSRRPRARKAQSRRLSEIKLRSRRHQVPLRHPHVHHSRRRPRHRRRLRSTVMNEISPLALSRRNLLVASGAIVVGFAARSARKRRPERRRRCRNQCPRNGCARAAARPTRQLHRGAEGRHGSRLLRQDGSRPGRRCRHRPDRRGRTGPPRFHGPRHPGRHLLHGEPGRRLGKHRRRERRQDPALCRSRGSPRSARSCQRETRRPRRSARHRAGRRLRQG